MASRSKLAAVLPGREIEPALAGAEEAALVGEAEQVGRLGERQVQPAEVLLGELAAGVVQQLDERCRFLLQAPLQRALAHAQLAGDFVAPRLAVRQPADDHFPRPVAGLRMVEMAEIVAGETLVQLRRASGLEVGSGAVMSAAANSRLVAGASNDTGQRKAAR